MNVQTLDINLVDEGKRSRADYGDIDALVLDIKEHGLYHPIVVYEKKEGDENIEVPYLLLAGGRRLNALRRLELTEIPAHIVERVLTAEEIKVIELHENFVRKDMTWHEEASLRKEIFDLQVKIHGPMRMKGGEKIGVSTEDVADMMNITRRQLTRDLELAEMIEKNPELKNSASKAEAIKKIEVAKEAMLKEELAKRQTAKMASKGTDHVRRNLLNAYIHGDAFEHMEQFPDNSFDIIEIDPPYAIDLKEKKKLKDDNQELDDYNEVPIKEYVDFMDRTLTQAARLLKDSGHLIVWFAPEPWFEVINRQIRSKGLDCTRIPGIWNKIKGQTMQPNYRLGNAYEMFFYARGERAVIAKAGTNNVFTFPGANPDDKIHPTERPIEMIQAVLETFGMKGARVLVPFAGSGNTILAAHNAGMTAIGYDLSQSYKKSYDLRVLTNEALAFSSYKK
jgi:site-specific DNA-methyltransferase (adenine-specific)